METIENKLDLIKQTVKEIKEKTYPDVEETMNTFNYLNYKPDKELTEIIFENKNIKLLNKKKWSKEFNKEIPERIIEENLTELFKNKEYKELKKIYQEFNFDSEKTLEQIGPLKEGIMSLIENNYINNYLEDLQFFKEVTAKINFESFITINEKKVNEKRALFQYNNKEYKPFTLNEHHQGQHETFKESLVKKELKIIKTKEELFNIKPSEHTMIDMIRNLVKTYNYQTIRDHYKPTEERISEIKHSVKKTIKKIEQEYDVKKTNIMSAVIGQYLTKIHYEANINKEYIENIFEEIKEITNTKNISETIKGNRFEVSNLYEVITEKNKKREIRDIFSVFKEIENQTGLKPSSEYINEIIKYKMNKE